MIEDMNSRWRKDVLRLARIGRQLERIAVRLELPDAECRPHFFRPTIDICAVGEDLPWFSASVRRIATRLGPATKVEAENWVGTGDRPPDLVARWALDEKVDGVQVDVLVRCLIPKGCKADPRTEYRERSEIGIHPECAAVLRELEDVGS